MSENPSPPAPDAASGSPPLLQRVGLVAGPLLCVAMLLQPPPATLGHAGWRTAAVAVLIATWWISEALPLAVTGLLPLVLFPVLGIAPIGQTSAPYANPVIFLFLGGFILAIAVEETGLHRRLALAVIGIVGTRPAHLVGGFMAATAFISLWVSNTATTLMMLPLAASVASLAQGEGEHDQRFATALLLGVAYASSIGGMGTLIGTPPNALFAGFAAQTLKDPMPFVRWMLVAMPVVLIALPLSWLILTRLVFRLDDGHLAGSADLLQRERAALGPVTRAERLVGSVALLTALAWVTRPLYDRFVPGANDTSIAVAAALVLFLVPVRRRPLGFVVRWERCERLPWGVLILFGGGLSLADAMQQTGLSTWLGNALSGLSALPPLLVLLVLVAAVVFVGELASNVAMVAAFLPISAAVAQAMGFDVMKIAVAVTLAASAGFMLPVATPPNAIVYATGRITATAMARAGVLLDLLLIAVIVGIVHLLGHRL